MPSLGVNTYSQACAGSSNPFSERPEPGMGRAHAGNTKMLYRQQEQQPKYGKQPSPQTPPPETRSSRGCKKRKNNSLLESDIPQRDESVMTHAGRGGDKNLRWNDLVCKVLADGGKSCHLLNFAKCSGSRPPRVECKVSPAFHLRSSQDRGGGQRCFLRSRMLTSDGTEFKTRTAMTYSSHFPSLAPLGVKIPQKE